MGRRKAVLAVDKVTGKVLRRYGSLADAERAEGFSHGSVCGQCKRRSLNSLRSCFRFEGDYDPREDMRGKSNRAVVALEGGRVALVFGGAREAAERLGCAPPTVAWALRSGRPLLGRFTLAKVDRMGQFGTEI